jgi:Methyltransferase domain
MSEMRRRDTGPTVRNWHGMFARLVSLARRLRHRRSYDPRRQKVVPLGHATYDPGKEITVPLGQSIYDANVFGRYDLTSQRVVSKHEAPPEILSLDILMPEAQRHARSADVALETDRYSQVLSILPPGSGVCLDACTNQPLERTLDCVTRLGYEYLPIDLHGDGTTVRIEDLTRLTFRDGSIARIISLDTLEHIDDYRTAIAELYRVLAEGGLAIFHVPCYYFEKAESEPIKPEVDPWGHVRYFSARDLVGSLQGPDSSS